MKSDIRNVNYKEQYHGYQEWYWGDELWFRCNYKNGNPIGYREYYYSKQRLYHIR